MRAQLDDQGLVNADPRNIAVPDGFVNMIPTDIRGITFARTPQQVRSPHENVNTKGISSSNCVVTRRPGFSALLPPVGDACDAALGLPKLEVER